ncbi:LysM peptidoglycan-binding domain-containing protein (plasmid) [Paraclostridium ghonii]|uniref:LysM peptidoglycan-binding domain-containing protein n=1 Tax=Paraclostridium ghonii TaxID=29358 RepID=UPI00202D09E6|nr:LysM peptidoglycan-binding domain-containing protein [Paeniclostridium ghonii]MCM0168162.1 LysM peptidoglycan-binding domain-containing protein [Paeniclostridium ghonii]
MEVWLGTDNDKIKLPITPATLGVDRSADIKTDDVIKLGEVDTFNGMKLKTIGLECFFPKQDYSFVSSNKLDPYEYSEKIQIWQNSGTVIRIIITGTPTNMLCRVQSFNTREQDGTRDLYFELNLIEHKPKNVTRLDNQSNVTQRTHKVVKGDNLWDISFKYYGKGSIYKKINEANKNRYPSLAKYNEIDPGMVLVIP